MARTTDDAMPPVAARAFETQPGPRCLRCGRPLVVAVTHTVPPLCANCREAALGVHPAWAMAADDGAGVAG